MEVFLDQDSFPSHHLFRDACFLLKFSLLPGHFGIVGSEFFKNQNPYMRDALAFSNLVFSWVLLLTNPGECSPWGLLRFVFMLFIHSAFMISSLASLFRWQIFSRCSLMIGIKWFVSISNINYLLEILPPNNYCGFSLQYFRLKHSL